MTDRVLDRYLTDEEFEAIEYAVKSKEAASSGVYSPTAQDSQIWALFGLVSDYRADRDEQREHARAALASQEPRPAALGAVREALEKLHAGLTALNEHHTQEHHGGHLVELDERVAEAFIAYRTTLAALDASAEPAGGRLGWVEPHGYSGGTTWQSVVPGFTLMTWRSPKAGWVFSLRYADKSGWRPMQATDAEAAKLEAATKLQAWSSELAAALEGERW